MHPAGTLGITTRFQELSPTIRQVSHALLTRSPLSPPNKSPVDPVRLACVKHAASVRPEPESNPPHKSRKPNTGPQKNKKTTSKTTPHHKAERSLTQTNTHTTPPQQAAQHEHSTGNQKPNQKPHPTKRAQPSIRPQLTKTYKHKSSTKHALEFSNHHHTQEPHPHTRKHTPTGSNKKQYTPHPTPHNPGVSHTPHHHITPHMLFPYYVFLHYALPGLIRPAPCLMAALPILSLPPRLKDENRSNRYHALASLISPIITGSFYYRHHPLQNPIHAAPDKISRYPCIYTDKTAEESR